MATKTKKVRKNHLKDLERLLFLVEYHRGLAANAEASVANILKVGYDIDLSRENWELDLDQGRLVNKGDHQLTGIVDIDQLAAERGVIPAPEADE
jgi:hypothetical protein